MEAGMRSLNGTIRRHDRAESSLRGPCSEMARVANTIGPIIAPIITKLLRSHLFRKVDRAFPKPANHAEGRAEDCGEKRVARAQ